MAGSSNVTHVDSTVFVACELTYLPRDWVITSSEETVRPIITVTRLVFQFKSSISSNLQKFNVNVPPFRGLSLVKSDAGAKRQLAIMSFGVVQVPHLGVGAGGARVALCESSWATLTRMAIERWQLHGANRNLHHEPQASETDPG
jgi:hypothetical protein